MTDDVETRLRAALQYNADRVELAEPQLRTQRARRSDNRGWAALAAAACVLAIVGASVFGRGLHHGATAAPSYEGRHWILRSVVHAGRTTAVPARLTAFVDFKQSRGECAAPMPTGESCLVMNDSVNTVSAAYRRTRNGFLADAAMSTAIGTTDRSRARQLIVAGIGSVSESAVAASVDGHQLTLSTPSYTLIFTDGHRQNTSSDEYTGRHWLLTSLRHNGRTVAIPARLGATIDFGEFTPMCPRPAPPARSCPGAIGINDSVNFMSGSYRLTADGFTTTNETGTLVGGTGSNPNLVMEAMDQLAYGRMTSVGSSGKSDVVASVDGDNLTLTVADYVLTLTAKGKSRLDTSSPSPTSSR